MNARELEDAQGRLRAGRRRTVEAAAFAAAAAGAAASLAPVSSTAAIALAAGAAVEALVAAAAFLSRRELIARLALEPDAYVLGDVDRYGKRLVRLHERQRLAAWLREVASDACVPGSFYLRERVARHADEFDSLAQELASPAAHVQPTSAVACLRLLTHAPESPLYNGRLPADELALALRAIRAGIRDAAPAVSRR